MKPPPGTVPPCGAGGGVAAHFAADGRRRATEQGGDVAQAPALRELDRDLFALHLRDSAPFPGGAVTAEYRRAILDVNGRMVAVSAYGLPGAGVPGAALLHDFAAAIRRASASAATRG